MIRLTRIGDRSLDSTERSVESRAAEARQPDGRSGDASPASTVALYRDIARVIDHMQRRLHDVVRVELGRIGVDDISPMQVLMLLNIGEDELSVRDLMERGYYLGSNASYNLKHLVEQGYVDRAASQRDRRAARLRLSEKGEWLCTEIGKLENRQATQLLRNQADGTDLETTYRMLRRLERMWGDIVRYDGRGQD
ncbi:MarR family transcriptional regulator [Niveispirillum sp. BGYR6]|uniref:MarR family transcriptional regulator n=1 Tax=Niveispirillum sp. BGYR6 TaxID=2971249 RepID=UPI0022B9A665|nr:MarR family transcriptional regulator [Niveispirillum sp. BGYR6]MDG5496610.1 MarR family transcriptional regulator [Niveispirillum sp. BGYR6]